MFVEDPKVRGKFILQTHNEVLHLRHLINSPASNPFRHIEGYYEDLDWTKYKSTSSHVSGPVGKTSPSEFLRQRSFAKNAPPSLLGDNGLVHDTNGVNTTKNEKHSTSNGSTQINSGCETNGDLTVNTNDGNCNNHGSNGIHIGSNNHIKQ